MSWDFPRLTDKAGEAMHWAFLAALRDDQVHIETTQLVVGIQCVNPGIYEGVDFAQIGFRPLDVSNVEQIQQEMQARFMKASLLRANEPAGTERGIHTSLSALARKAFETARKTAEGFGQSDIATPHLLYGVLKEDSDLAAKFIQAGLDESKVFSFCQEFKKGQEGETMAESVGRLRSRSFRTGIGYDLHRLAEGRKLIIGGIEILCDKGPVGHSDGDVLAHALCDALLGAAGLGDIGTHFPDNDPKWKGANSLLFLEQARKLLDENHFTIEYVDAVVILERPKLGPHFQKMREALAKSLGIHTEKIHLKAKTNEGVDAVGHGEAIACHVVATLSS